MPIRSDRLAALVAKRVESLWINSSLLIASVDANVLGALSAAQLATVFGVLVRCLSSLNRLRPNA